MCACVRVRARLRACVRARVFVSNVDSSDTLVWVSLYCRQRQESEPFSISTTLKRAILQTDVYL